MRKLLRSEELLLQSCSQYNNIIELQQKAPHKYFMLKKRNLLKILFPEHTCQLPPDYIDPSKITNYKKELIDNIKNTIKALQIAKLKIDKASTIDEVNKNYKPVKNIIKIT